MKSKFKLSLFVVLSVFLFAACKQLPDIEAFSYTSDDGLKTDSGEYTTLSFRLENACEGRELTIEVSDISVLELDSVNGLSVDDGGRYIYTIGKTDIDEDGVGRLEIRVKGKANSAALSDVLESNVLIYYREKEISRATISVDTKMKISTDKLGYSMPAVNQQQLVKFELHNVRPDKELRFTVSTSRGNPTDLNASDRVAITKIAGIRLDASDYANPGALVYKTKGGENTLEIQLERMSPNREEAFINLFFDNPTKPYLTIGIDEKFEIVFKQFNVDAGDWEEMLTLRQVFDDNFPTDEMIGEVQDIRKHVVKPEGEYDIWYKFAGWTGDDISNVKDPAYMNSNLYLRGKVHQNEVLYAMYEIHKHTVTYKKYNGSSWVDMKKITVESGTAFKNESVGGFTSSSSVPYVWMGGWAQSLSSYTDPDNMKGNAFSGWIQNSDITVYATYKIKPVKIIYWEWNKGRWEETKRMSANYGSPFDSQTAKYSNVSYNELTYEFSDGWTAGNYASKYPSNIPDVKKEGVVQSDINVYAIYKLKKQRVNVWVYDKTGNGYKNISIEPPYSPTSPRMVDCGSTLDKNNMSVPAAYKEFEIAVGETNYTDPGLSGKYTLAGWYSKTNSTDNITTQILTTDSNGGENERSLAFSTTGTYKVKSDLELYAVYVRRVKAEYYTYLDASRTYNAASNVVYYKPGTSLTNSSAYNAPAYTNTNGTAGGGYTGRWTYTGWTDADPSGVIAPAYSQNSSGLTPKISSSASHNITDNIKLWAIYKREIVVYYYTYTEGSTYNYTSSSAYYYEPGTELDGTMVPVSPAKFNSSYNQTLVGTYTHIGWTTDSHSGVGAITSGTKNNGITTTAGLVLKKGDSSVKRVLNDSAKLYAVYERNYVTVTFKWSTTHYSYDKSATYMFYVGASITKSSYTPGTTSFRCTSAHTVTEGTTPAPCDYTWSGWINNSSRDSGNHALWDSGAFSSLTVNSDTTVYAVYSRALLAKVNYYLFNHGSKQYSASPDSTVYYASGTKLTGKGTNEPYSSNTRAFNCAGYGSCYVNEHCDNKTNNEIHCMRGGDYYIDGWTMRTSYSGQCSSKICTNHTHVPWYSDTNNSDLNVHFNCSGHTMTVSGGSTYNLYAAYRIENENSLGPSGPPPVIK